MARSHPVTRYLVHGNDGSDLVYAGTDEDVYGEVPRRLAAEHGCGKANCSA